MPKSFIVPTPVDKFMKLVLKLFHLSLQFPINKLVFFVFGKLFLPCLNLLVSIESLITAQRYKAFLWPQFTKCSLKAIVLAGSSQQGWRLWQSAWFAFQCHFLSKCDVFSSIWGSIITKPSFFYQYFDETTSHFHWK